MNTVRRQIQSMLQVEPRPGGFRAVLTVDKDLVLLPGHFADHPILPGICMMQAVLLAAAQTLGLPDMNLHTLKNAKLMLPVRPGERVTIDADLVAQPDGRFSVKARFLAGENRAAEFSLIAQAPLQPAEGASA
jgi:3-hydroxymyristoyl/3-hydroxydecanoyl-(acyl carrier protein) dehydratase